MPVRRGGAFRIMCGLAVLLRVRPISGNRRQPGVESKSVAERDSLPRGQASGREHERAFVLLTVNSLEKAKVFLLRK